MREIKPSFLPNEVKTGWYLLKRTGSIGIVNLETWYYDREKDTFFRAFNQINPRSGAVARRVYAPGMLRRDNPDGVSYHWRQRYHIELLNYLGNITLNNYEANRDLFLDPSNHNHTHNGSFN